LLRCPDPARSLLYHQGLLVARELLASKEQEEEEEEEEEEL
jgi:hypothetical protein